MTDEHLLERMLIGAKAVTMEFLLNHPDACNCHGCNLHWLIIHYEKKNGPLMNDYERGREDAAKLLESVIAANDQAFKYGAKLIRSETPKQSVPVADLNSIAGRLNQNKFVCIHCKVKYRFGIPITCLSNPSGDEHLYRQDVEAEIRESIQEVKDARSPSACAACAKEHKLTVIGDLHESVEYCAWCKKLNACYVVGELNLPRHHWIFKLSKEINALGLGPEIVAKLTIHINKAIEELQSRIHDDNPNWDGTDYAHPAWWRGHERTTQIFCEHITKILDGKDDGIGSNIEPWASVRKRLILREVQRKAAIQTETLDARRALLALSDKFPTPVEGYGSNTSWAISDLIRAMNEFFMWKAAAMKEFVLPIPAEIHDFLLALRKRK